MDDTKTEWIHVLLRGERNCSGDNCETTKTHDNYNFEFERRSLTAVTVPILEFTFKNLNILLRALMELSETDLHNGLIITSPRVVESLNKALDGLNQEAKVHIIKRINSELVFAIGDKSSKDCYDKLGLECNRSAIQSGNSFELARFVKHACKQLQNTVLIYPKSSLADTTIEDLLKDVNSVKIRPIIVYETNTTDNISLALIKKLASLKISNEVLYLIVNLIFFSPSGVEGFSKVDRAELNSLVSSVFPQCKQIQFKFSSIGKTTEAALRDKNYEIFCVATKPNAESLVESIFNKCSDFKMN